MYRDDTSIRHTSLFEGSRRSRALCSAGAQQGVQRKRKRWKPEQGSLLLCHCPLFPAPAHLAQLFSGLDILERVRDADLDDTRDTSGEHGFSLVLRLQVRGRSHISALLTVSARV